MYTVAYRLPLNRLRFTYIHKKEDIFSAQVWETKPVSHIVRKGVSSGKTSSNDMANVSVTADQMMNYKVMVHWT
jgi:hypothetical protein